MRSAVRCLVSCLRESLSPSVHRLTKAHSHPPTYPNSRLAMLATAGLATQEYLTGQGAVEQLLSGHISPFGDGQGAF